MTTAIRMKASSVEGLSAEEHARQAELLALAHDQRVQLRADAENILDALATGLTRYRDAIWKWDFEDMMPVDPNNWRRCAKLALLFAQLDAVRHALDWQASTRPLAPLWCAECEDAPYPGPPYLNSPCLAHDTTPRSAADWADAIWGTK